MPNFAVITPTNRIDSFLWECIKSLRTCATERTPISHIIVLDGISDTPPDLSSIGGGCYQVVVLHNDGDGGVSSARNCGLRFVYNRVSEFQYFGFLDSDDLVEKSYFTTILSANDPNRSALFFGQGIKFGESKDISGFSNTNLPAGEVKKGNLFWNCVGCPTGVFVTLSHESGGIYFDESLPILEDWRFYLQVAENVDRLVKIEGKYGYRVHLKQSTRNLNVSERDGLRRSVSKSFSSVNVSKLEAYIVSLRIRLSFVNLYHDSFYKKLIYSLCLSMLAPRWFRYKAGGFLSKNIFYG